MDKKATDVFKSKRFWSGVIGLLAIIITGLAPDLQEHIDTMIPAIVSIVGFLIGGYALQDTASAMNKSGNDS